jgi:hypothetical protein
MEDYLKFKNYAEYMEKLKKEDFVPPKACNEREVTVKASDLDKQKWFNLHELSYFDDTVKYHHRALVFLNLKVVKGTCIVDYEMTEVSCIQEDGIELCAGQVLEFPFSIKTPLLLSESCFQKQLLMFHKYSEDFEGIVSMKFAYWGMPLIPDGHKFGPLPMTEVVVRMVEYKDDIKFPEDAIPVMDLGHDEYGIIHGNVHGNVSGNGNCIACYKDECGMCCLNEIKIVKGTEGTAGTEGTEKIEIFGTPHYFPVVLH